MICTFDVLISWYVNSVSCNNEIIMTITCTNVFRGGKGVYVPSSGMINSNQQKAIAAITVSCSFLDSLEYSDILRITGLLL